LPVSPIFGFLSGVAGHRDENKDMLTLQEHETAKRDFGCFPTVIEIANGYYAAEPQDLGTRTLHYAARAPASDLPFKS